MRHGPLGIVTGSGDDADPARAQDVLAIQDPPNDGVLWTAGALGSDLDGLVGFDIAASGIAYAAR